MKKITRVFIATIVVALGLTGFVGCGRSFDLDKNISVVAREDGSGTKSAFMEIIGLKGKADVSGVIIGTGTAGVLAEVKSNPHSIAYESLGYVTDDVKKLKVDGVEATVENIKLGTYKIARPLNIVYKSTTIESGAEKMFYEYLQSAEAQSTITSNGYVSTKDDASTYQTVAGGNLSGEVTLSGSTSLQPLMIVLAENFEKLYTNITVTVSGGGSGTGYTNAENGTSDFGMISESFKQAKAESCVYYEVAKDGIAVIVNKLNEFDNITLSDLKNIYNAEQEEASKISSWSQVSK